MTLSGTDAITFSTGTITLTMKDAEGNFLTASVYSIPGVNNDLPMSIGQLVMAICLARATELEGKIIGLMEEMDNTSAELEMLTEIEKNLLENKVLTNEQLEYLDSIGMDLRRDAYELANYIASNTPIFDYNDGSKLLAIIMKLNRYYEHRGEWLSDEELYLLDRYGISAVSDTEDHIKDLETKMDAKNSFSQEKMIELQSQTNKRDQAYDMVANILKSLNTTLHTNASNM